MLLDGAAPAASGLTADFSARFFGEGRLLLLPEPGAKRLPGVCRRSGLSGLDAADRTKTWLNGYLVFPLEACKKN